MWEKIRIKGFASFGAGGAGAKVTKWSGSGSSSSFYDYFPCPNVSAANGGAAFYGVSFVTVGGISWGQMTLGHLFQHGPSLTTGVAGLDISAMIGMGASTVTDFTIENCDSCGAK